MRELQGSFRRKFQFCDNVSYVRLAEGARSAVKKGCSEGHRRASSSRFLRQPTSWQVAEEVVLGFGEGFGILLTLLQEMRCDDYVASNR